MSKNDKNKISKFNSDNLTTGGYKPVNDGYQGINKKGYTPTTNSNTSSLPKPPEGGTGEVSRTSKDKA